MKNLGFILLLGILLISACNTQVQRTASQQQIANLQEGCMVVRLSKRTKKVDMLQRAGYTKRAEAELKIRNKASATRNRFENLCSVLLIYRLLFSFHR